MGFHLNGIPLMPRGVPQIEVTYDLDSNGILNVSALEKSTGKENKIQITNDAGRLSKEEVERMVAEEEKLKEKIPEDDKKKVDAKIDEVLNWLNENDGGEKEIYEEKQKELEAIANPILTAAYGAATGGAPGGMPGGMPGGFPGGAPGEAPGGADPNVSVEEVD